MQLSDGRPYNEKSEILRLSTLLVAMLKKCKDKRYVEFITESIKNMGVIPERFIKGE